jgi:hypothetical protein
MKEHKREFVCDPQTDRGLKEWAEEENRSLRNLTAVIVRRAVSEWREERNRRERARANARSD